MKRIIIGALGLAAFLTSVHASTILEVGFEPPNYSLGALSGQNGWGGSGVGVVENTLAYAGTQAVEDDNSAAAGQYIDAHAVSYNSLTDPDQTVELSIEAYFTGSDDEDWDALVGLSSAGLLGQLLIIDGDATLGSSGTHGSVPISLDTWNRYTLIFNFASDTESAYYNTTLIATAAFANPGTNLTVVGMGYNDKFGTATNLGYFDNLAAVSVPEPSTFALTLCGAALAGLWLYRRRALSAQ